MHKKCLSTDTRSTSVPLYGNDSLPAPKSRGLACIQVDEKTDFSKLKVTQLKQLLKDRGASCPECVEKNDFVKRVRSLYVSGSSGEL